MSIVHPPKPMAHGTGTDPVEPDWPVLTIDEVDRILRLYPGVGAATEILSYSPRPFSAGSLVSTARARLFVKRHHRSVRDVAGLTEEHAFMAHLQAKGIPVSTVLLASDGGSAIAADDWTYEVHQGAPGFDLYQQAMSWTPFLSVAHARSAGRVLAELHVASASYDAPRRKVQPLISSFTIFMSSDPMAELERYIQRRPALAEFLARYDWRKDCTQILLPFYAKLRPHLTALVPSWGHNDWHASNLLWNSDRSDAQVSTVIDFGLADRTSSIYDLATAIERNIIEWLAVPEQISDAVHFDQLDALLDGYESISPLAAAQMDALVAILPLVHAEFALSEVDYFYGITHSADNARVAYETFLLGHAEWFSSAQGQLLLEHLKERQNHGV